MSFKSFYSKLINKVLKEEDYFDLASEIYKSDRSKITTPEKILKYIDKNTKGHLNYSAIKSNLNSEWYVKNFVPVSMLKIQDEDLVEPGNKSLDPIVIDSNFNIIDGRHRAVQHKKIGFDQIEAWMPIEVYARLYNLSESNSSGKKFWYHGDVNEFSNFNHFRMDRDPANNQDDLFNGPGIYFTESESEALNYAEPDGYVYRVELEGNIVGEDHTLTLEMAKKLIQWMPEEKMEELKDRYFRNSMDLDPDNEDDEEVQEVWKELFSDLRESAEKYANYGQGNWIAPTVGLYQEFYGYEHANEFTNSIVSLGIDGFHVKFDGRNHVVMYNPKKIGVWEVKPYNNAYEKIYGDDDDEY